MIPPDLIEQARQVEPFLRRRARGLPPDRWASTAEMELVAQGIEALTIILALIVEDVPDAAPSD